jgi:hypothetical protein
LGDAGFCALPQHIQEIKFAARQLSQGGAAQVRAHGNALSPVLLAGLHSATVEKQA